VIGHLHAKINVKEQCNGVAKRLIEKLHRKFHAQKVMNNTCIIYFDIGYNHMLPHHSLTVQPS